MKKTGKRFAKLTAILMASSLVIQAAFVPVMADEVSIDETELLNSVESMVPTGPVTAEINVGGSFNGTNLDVDVVSVTDMSQAAGSMKGEVSIDGSAMDLTAYMDSQVVELQIPGLPALSYDYTTVASDSLLAQVFGEEMLNAINQVLKLINCAYLGGNPEGMAKLSEEIAQIYSELAEKLEFEAAPEKECLVGGETVTCQGIQTTITKELVSEAANKMMGVTLPNGQTYREYFDMVFSLSASQGTEGVPASVDEFLESYLNVPDMTLAIYATEEGTPVEVDLTAEGSTIVAQFRGPAEMPWSEIAISIDGSEMAVVKVDVTENGVEITATSNDTVLASLVVNTTDMSFEFSTVALPSSITGNIEFDDEAIVINAAYDGLTIKVRAYEGGTVEKPEADGKLDLTNLTEEEFNNLFANLGTLFGGAAAAQDAA